MIIAVDDYGNVRLDSKKAREKMNKAGLLVRNRFDAYDTLETREDLEMLYETLTSVKDQHGKSAVFTPYSLSCNLDFERMRQDDYIKYSYEPLTQTFEKLSIFQGKEYEGTWQLWQEGMSKGIFQPQFHGREHLNVKVLNEKLEYKDPEVLIALKNRSYTSITSTGYPTIGYTNAFAFYNKDEIQDFPNILTSGIKCFQEVFGFKPNSFTPPAQQFPKELESSLLDLGIENLDKPFYRSRHLGEGKFKKEFNFLGVNKATGLTDIVRNVVFEPCENRGFDWINYTFQQIEAAFNMGKAAIISSHRVNFCGHIDPKNREKGILALKELLKKVERKWPEIEFLNMESFGNLISGKNKD
ncbi:hypothetical protein [Pararhodonellum marinum]|uniref:hypothetical protein n=1 Tax=Pararhodonellum marinum TaxID=2755358 RepID=UPI00188FE4BF|nr:hypothetical protein [Pararhodonellum marinum]